MESRPTMIGPLLTADQDAALRAAAARGQPECICSLDLGRTEVTVAVDPEGWLAHGIRYPFVERCRERTIYYWHDGWHTAARYSHSLIKLVPSGWGAPTFEIDGIKMLPTAGVSPWEDAVRKVALIKPRGATVLDTCGGLGYFAAACLAGGAVRIVSYEKNADVLWLRTINPWSPVADDRLELHHGDVSAALHALPDAAFDAVLHDPPRFGIAGELCSQAFYDQLARVLRRRGRLFHYTGTPNRLTSGRDVPREVARRLKLAGFATEPVGDGVLAVRR